MLTQYSKKQLRSFGLTVGGIFLVIAAWPWLRRGQDPRQWALILGSALVLPGIIAPSILRRPYRWWMQLAHILGAINSRIILAVMFYTVFTPMAIAMRLIGKDPMNRSFASNAGTYRIPRQARNASHMKHQF